jgi:hypothetical protein
MRTIFEDVNEQADIDDDGQEGRTRIKFWLGALLSFALAFGTYYWIKHRKPAAPPPPPVSLNDDNQLNTTVNQFTALIKAGNWDDATKMVSSEGMIRLRTENKTLRDSLLVERSKDVVSEALLTPSRSRTPSTARLDTAFLFANGETKIVPITLVEENGRLAVNSW